MTDCCPGWKTDRHYCIHKVVQGDQKVSVHLTITVQSSGSQTLIYRPVPPNDGPRYARNM